MKRLLSSLCLILLFASTAMADRNIFVSESTGAERRIPVLLLDVTDGLTEETGVTITVASECRISKNGGAAANCAGTAGEVETGIYYYEPTAGEVDTIGYITVRINDSAARAFYGSANIVAFDPTSTAPNVNVLSVSTSAIESQDFASSGTAQSYTANTLTLQSDATYGDNALAKGTVIHIDSATTGAGQSVCILSNVGSTDVITTVKNFSPALSGTVIYSLYGQSNCDALQPTTPNVTLDVAAGGEAGIDWGNMANKTATNALTGTTISTSQAVASVSGAVGSVTGNVTVGGMSVSALADFLDTSTGITSASAIEGSVAKETADLVAGGGSGDVPPYHNGTAVSYTTTTVRLAAGETYGDNTLKNDNAVWIASATTGAGQFKCIKSNTLSNDTVTIWGKFSPALSGTVEYWIIPSKNCDVSLWPQGH